MKEISPEFQNHLNNEVTTLARCWVVEPKVGTAIGFTDHDEDLIVMGTLCEREAGFERSKIEESLGLKIDTLEVVGALASEQISEKDILAGRYDNAKVTTYLVNWSEPEQILEDKVMYISAITREDGAFRMELQGPLAELDQSQGWHFIEKCQADLGDSKCKIDLTSNVYKTNGIISAVRSSTVIVVTGLDDFASAFFSNGRLSWTSGDNQNQSIEISEHRHSEIETVLVLWDAMPSSLKVGDNFMIHAGCDKQFNTCRGVFSNIQNFRGFPHIPGNDFSLSVPKDGGKFDGGPLVK